MILLRHKLTHDIGKGIDKFIIPLCSFLPEAGSRMSTHEVRVFKRTYGAKWIGLGLSVVRSAEYPQTAEIQNRDVDMIARTFLV